MVAKSGAIGYSGNHIKRSQTNKLNCGRVGMRAKQGPWAKLFPNTLLYTPHLGEPLSRSLFHHCIQEVN